MFGFIEVDMSLAEADKATYACGLLCPHPTLMLSISFSGYADCPEDMVLYQEHQCGKYIWHVYVFIWLCYTSGGPGCMYSCLISVCQHIPSESLCLQVSLGG